MEQLIHTVDPILLPMSIGACSSSTIILSSVKSPAAGRESREEFECSPERVWTQHLCKGRQALLRDDACDWAMKRQPHPRDIPRRLLWPQITLKRTSLSWLIRGT